tara:strand:+ start:260 stop:1627 length:1368 start_codon:yes stop_codon:yes gene_type:complete
MTKSYLNKRGYVILKEHYDFDLLNEIRKELTVKPYVTPGYSDPNNAEEYEIYEENERKLYLPKIYALNKLGKPDLDKSPKPASINLNFNGELRENQKEVVDISIKAMNNNGGGILVLPCGYGKTCIGLYLVSHIKRKTLVICHKEFLINQWKERIQQFLPEAQIGRIQAQKFDIDGKDIVLCMLQSLSMKDYELDAFNSFDFVIIDECHHISSRVFSRALRKVNCNYHIGLSATPQRADRLMKVLEWHIGGIIFKVSNKDDVKLKRTVKVKRYSITSDNPKYFCELLNYKQKPNVVKMITNLIQYKQRTDLIVKIILELVKEKRNILLLSERRDHLITISNFLKENEFEDWAYYMGGIKEKDLKFAENRKVILGTYQMCSEGYDNSNLDTLILATSKGNVEQSVGRILRKDEYDIEPMVVDFTDNFSAFINQSKKRMSFYKKKKYDITTEYVELE